MDDDIYDIKPKELYMINGVTDYEKQVILTGHEIISEVNEKCKDMGRNVDFRGIFNDWLKDIEDVIDKDSSKRKRVFIELEDIMDSFMEKDTEQVFENYRNYEMGIYKYPF